MKDIRTVKIFNKKFKVYNKSCCNESTKRTLYVEVTSKCNARCSFCYNNDVTYKESSREINIYKLRDVIIELLDKGCIDKVAITGGEPLVYDGIEMLLDLLDSFLDSGKLKHYSMTTNGICLDDYVSVITNSYLTYLNISIHHYDETRNKKILGARDTSYLYSNYTYENLCDHIRTINKHTRINFVLNGYCNTLDDIEKMIELTKRLGATKLLIRNDNNNYIRGIKEFMKTYISYRTKESTKCICNQYIIDGIEVEYRSVNNQLEEAIETKQEYIRNFVYKCNNTLMCGWSKNSLKIN